LPFTTKESGNGKNYSRIALHAIFLVGPPVARLIVMVVQMKKFSGWRPDYTRDSIREKPLVVKMMCGKFFQEREFYLYRSRLSMQFIGDLFSFQDDYYYASRYASFGYEGDAFQVLKQTVREILGKQI